MGHAPTHTCFAPYGDGSIRGCFTHKETNAFFEFSAAPADDQCFGDYYNSRVWLGSGGYRLARVKKTVAYVIVDEDGMGNPVIEKWPLKKFERYPRP